MFADIETVASPLAVCLVAALLAGCSSDQRQGGWQFGTDAGQEEADAEVDVAVSATCGNGRVEGEEVCDGEALAGKTCGDFGYEGGTLKCNDACAGYLVSECEGIPDLSYWGDGDWNMRESDPCEACGPDEACIKGECKPRTCGEGEAPRRIDETYELRSVTVSGRLVFPSGADLPQTGTAFVEFQQPDSSTVSGVSWSIGESETFERELLPGTYEVYASPAYVTDGVLYGRQLLRSNYELDEAGEPHRLELEAEPPKSIEPIELRGEVTVNGRLTSAGGGHLRVSRISGSLPTPHTRQ